ncbi:hypothetical protein KM043_007635 [Ampulex compressa]|nr:hypothetical protein KM043_007635 [Ampulex compressa]
MSLYHACYSAELPLPRRTQQRALGDTLIFELLFLLPDPLFVPILDKLLVSSPSESVRRIHACVCGKSFTRMQDLSRHRVLHCLRNPSSRINQSGIVRPYRCADCGSSYSRKGHLMSHRKHDCGQIKVCTDCGKSFLRRNGLLNHRRNGCPGT